ncbi:hypothetical protein OG21DRAFT_1414235 [Imleria badia]|nr:hypothetical protein OG21DRAFT_1414235 [Imleria badia]
MASSSYSPDEPHATIVQEEAWLQGTFLSIFFFGIQTTLCAFTFFAVLKSRTPTHNRMRMALLTYVAVLFAVTTASQGLLLDWIQMSFITQRNYPGGPSAFLSNEYAIPVNLASDILVVCANWMMESLLVWRCYVLCSTGERMWSLAVILPLCLLIGVFATGSLFIHFNLHGAPPTTYALAYGVSSLVLNITATGFIAGRLFVYRHHVVSQLGRGYGQHYVTIAAVMIESAALYTGFLVVVIVAYAVGSPAANTLQQVIEPVQAISSLLIILRVANGEGWNTSTETGLVSAVVSSRNTRAGAVPEQSVNVIQLEMEVVSTQRDEETSVSRKEDYNGRIGSISMDAVV